MSEDEAKTMFCPQKLASDNHFDRKCEASACMVWRWRLVQTNKDRTTNSMMWPPVEPIYERTDQGGCGLAGAPQ